MMVMLRGIYRRRRSMASGECRGCLETGAMAYFFLRGARPFFLGGGGGRGRARTSTALAEPSRPATVRISNSSRESTKRVSFLKP